MHGIQWARRNRAVLVLLAGELLGGLFIIWHRGYTEIDWKAYMQEVAGVMDWDFNYVNLRGDTGPLVYPAGFVYLYVALRYFTVQGTDIRLAQYFFLGVYLVNLAVVFRIYQGVLRHVGEVAVVLCCLSYRMHSIYMLRLFNDPVAMLFLHLCILMMTQNKWSSSVGLYSLALSVKMNILLYLPGLLLVLLWALNYRAVLKTVLFIVLSQLALAAPFLHENSAGYLTRAFDFSRSFEQKWSVNWQFLSEAAFSSRYFHSSLLVLHVALLLVFLFKKCAYGSTLKQKLRSLNCPVSLHGIVSPPMARKHIEPLSNSYSASIYVMFSVNAIGVACSRSLHYQFYSWYFYSLPFFTCFGGFSVLRLAMFLGFELVFLVYPPSALMSWVLQALHIWLLLRITLLVERATPQDYIHLVSKEG